MEEELDLREIFDIFWSKKLIISIVAVIGIIFGVIYTNYIVVPKYSSSVTLVLTKAMNDSEVTNDMITQNDIVLNQKLIATYSEIIKSKKIINNVITELNLEMDYDELMKCVDIKSVSNADVIKVTVTTGDAELSALIANYITEAFREEVARIYSIQNIFIIDAGEVENEPVNISLVKNVAIFGMVALILVMMVIFLVYFFDTSIKSEEEVSKMLEVPVLAVIPFDKENGGKNDEDKK